MQEHDASFVERVLAGETAAFGPLVERHYLGALQLARRLLGEPADAADVVQEAYLQAFLSLRALRNSAHFGTWLLGIVINLCRMHLRSQRDVYAWDDGSGGRRLPGLTWADTQPSPEALYEVRELHDLVLAAIITLPLAQQEAVWLYYLEGLTLREMSLLVGVPLGTVKARLHRARTLLRQALEHIGIRAQTLVQGVDKEDSMIEVIVHDVILWVCMGARVHEVDARPSDAINLALRLRVPIFVDPVVFARASLSPESVLSEAEAQY